ncbi:carbohydrate sulfotransferase 11-like [Acanthaster planci]|uniref:Carbohydrate sulfotransferase n=1 Tax=Acanthaster planci TaxID=133434 RepID=A0A8B7ZF96_ACAPL|nr:carbohydrate sulfotransferase 11-like [Acanthaster planci]
MVCQPTRRLSRMVNNKRIFVCCLCLALVAVALFIMQPYDSYYAYSGRFGSLGKGTNRDTFDFMSRRQLFSVGLSGSNRSKTWEDEQAFRKKLVSDTCQAVRKRSKGIYPRLVYNLTKAHDDHLLKFLLVVDSLKTVYCYVPKVGTTSWKRLVLFLEGKVNSTDEVGQKKTHNLTNIFIRNLNSFTLEEVTKVLASYKKFLFVRNPFERILSAYQDKFQNDYPASTVFRRIWSERIIRYSSSDQTEALPGGKRRSDGTLNVSFPEFARFVGESLDSGVHNSRNEHWMEVYRLCHPCAIEYDWIGHYESMQTDANKILRAVGVDPAVKFPNFTTNPTDSSSYSTLQRYYSQLSTDDIVAVYKKYFLDFFMFGYDIPSPIKLIMD